MVELMKHFNKEFNAPGIIADVDPQRLLEVENEVVEVLAMMTSPQPEQ